MDVLQIRLTELVHQPLGVLRLPDDAFLVVLTDGTAQLVVIHRGPVFPAAPEAGYLGGVFNLEDTSGPVRPLDAVVVAVSIVQEFPQELPQVDRLLPRPGSARRGG